MAQLVAHSLWERGVVSSSLAAPTIFYLLSFSQETFMKKLVLILSLSLFSINIFTLNYDTDTDILTTSSSGSENYDIDQNLYYLFDQYGYFKCDHHNAGILYKTIKFGKKLSRKQKIYLAKLHNECLKELLLKSYQI